MQAKPIYGEVSCFDETFSPTMENQRMVAYQLFPARSFSSTKDVDDVYIWSFALSVEPGFSVLNLIILVYVARRKIR